DLTQGPRDEDLRLHPAPLRDVAERKNKPPRSDAPHRMRLPSQPTRAAVLPVPVRPCLSESARVPPLAHPLPLRSTRTQHDTQRIQTSQAPPRGIPPRRPGPRGGRLPGPDAGARDGLEPPP